MERGAGQSAKLARRLASSDIGRILQVGILTQGLTLISGPLSARLLGPTGRGDVALIAVVTYVVTGLASMALSLGVAHVVAKYDGSARDLLGSWMRSWSWALIVPGLVATVAAAALLHGQPVWGLAAVQAGIITVIACSANIARACVVGEQRVSYAATSNVLYTLAYVGSVVALFVTIHRAPAAWFLPTIIAGQLAGFLFLTLSLKRTRPARPTDSAHRAELLSFARRSYISAIGTVDRLGLDALIVGAVLGRAQLGLYSVVLATTTVPLVVLSGVGTALLPRMSALEPGAAIVLMRRWLLGSLGVAVVFAAAMCAVLTPAITIFFGSEFVPAIPAAIILALTSSIGGLRYPLTAAAQAQGRAARASKYDLVVSVAVLVAVFVGATVDGITGAALGLLLVNLAAVLATLTLLDWRVPEAQQSLT